MKRARRAEGPCSVCREAHENPASRNHRGNPSMLVSFRAAPDAVEQHVLFDCGKTFRSSVCRHFPAVGAAAVGPLAFPVTADSPWLRQLGVRYLTGVVLTHDHADACFGLDDLRELQRTEPIVLPSGVRPPRHAPKLPEFWRGAPPSTHTYSCLGCGAPRRGFDGSVLVSAHRRADGGWFAAAPRCLPFVARSRPGFY